MLVRQIILRVEGVYRREDSGSKCKKVDEEIINLWSMREMGMRIER